MENYLPGGDIPPEAQGFPDHMTGLPIGSLQDYHGPYELHDGIAYRFDPAYDPHLRMLHAPPPVFPSYAPPTLPTYVSTTVPPTTPQLDTAPRDRRVRLLLLY
jgi:hypothetical protein